MLARISLLSLLLLTDSAWPYFQKDMMKAKVQAKSQSRWTLADWLAQKNRNRLQDQWLAMNRSADWFEFNIGGGYGRYDLTSVDINGASQSKHTANAYHAEIFASIFHFFGEYEITNDRIESFGGGAGLRLLGSSSQTTNLVLRYGWRKRQNLRVGENWENEFAEAAMQLYIFKFFGLVGKYRQYGASISNLENTYRGTRTTAGVFLEYGILRGYVDFYREPTQVDRGSESTEERREGLEYGVRFHF